MVSFSDANTVSSVLTGHTNAVWDLEFIINKIICCRVPLMGLAGYGIQRLKHH
jgi:hypothetical protein